MLDNCYTMDLFCNLDLVENVTKDEKKIKLQGNGGTLVVTHKTTVAGYKQEAWFNKDAITNIIALKNLIKKYQVTYDSIDQIFLAHREDKGKPNMDFNMHESRLHYYNSTDTALVLINTVSKTRKYFS